MIKAECTAHVLKYGICKAGSNGVCKGGSNGVCKVGSNGVCKAGSNGVCKVGSNGVCKAGSNGVCKTTMQLSCNVYVNLTKVCSQAKVLSIARCVHTQVMKPLCNLSYNVGRPVSTAMYPSNNANLKRSEHMYQQVIKQSGRW